MGCEGNRGVGGVSRQGDEGTRRMKQLFFSLATLLYKCCTSGSFYCTIDSCLAIGNHVGENMIKSVLQQPGYAGIATVNIPRPQHS